MASFMWGRAPIRSTWRAQSPTATASKRAAEAVMLDKPSLAETIHSLINGSLSGVLLPAFSLDRFQSATETVRKQAIQIGEFAPILLGSHPEWLKGTWRDELTAYLVTYAEEARERGLPLIHALP